MKSLLAAALVICLSLGLVVACGQADETDEPTGGGIQVHGHWTVTVTDPDGTIASTHKFDNDLAGSAGSSLLTGLLAGVGTVESHGIDVFRPVGAWSCAEAVKSSELATFAWDEIPAVFIRDDTKAGNPFMLTGACTVTGLTEGTSAVTKVQSRFNLDTNISFCMLTTVSCVAMKTFSLTVHKETIPVLNNQLLAFNIVFSFE